MISKRHLIKTLAVGAAAAALLGAFGSAQAQTKLKWAHVYETSEPYHKYSVWAGEEIKKRTDGRYEIQVFPASSLGKESDINQGLTLGTVDIILTGASFAGRSYPPLAVSYFPFIFRDADHLLKYAKSDVFKELAKGYDDKTGNHITALTYYGARDVTSNAAHPVAKPEDMKGLKIRVPDAPAYLAFPKALGANPTPIAFAEVYLALQNGTVDAQENPLPTIEAKKFYEVQKNISLTGHIIDSLLTVVSGQTHPNSPRRFTQHQLFACLVLKIMLRTDYRGVVAVLTDSPELAQAIKLNRVPHYTTLQKAADRMLGCRSLNRLLDVAVATARDNNDCPAVAAIDSTGLRTDRASRYYTKRARREGRRSGPQTRYSRYPKLGVVCDCSSHMILAVHTSQGPSPDVSEFTAPLKRACRRRRLSTILADAGYDSEANHAWARAVLGVQTIIRPARGPKSLDPPRTPYRREMAEQWDQLKYGRRWQVETTMSMLKRRLGESTWSRTTARRRRDLYLMALTHDILILYRLRKIH